MEIPLDDQDPPKIGVVGGDLVRAPVVPCSPPARPFNPYDDTFPPAPSAEEKARILSLYFPPLDDFDTCANTGL